MNSTKHHENHVCKIILHLHTLKFDQQTNKFQIIFKKVHFWELSALFNQLYALNSYVYHLVVTIANPKPREIVDKIFSADWM